MQTIMNKCIAALALMLVMSAFLFAGNTAQAAEFSLNTDVISIEDVWVEGESLNIRILDKRTGQNQTINIAVKEYVSPADEFITVQTVDADGNVTNTVQIANPIYDPDYDPDATAGIDIPSINIDAGDDDELPPVEPDEDTNEPESPIPDEYRPLTPDGTGTVVDNVTESDGKEFFSISTDDGNVFYLIVDRQREGDNVYLLNAVTEYDLFSLAQDGDGLPKDYPEPPADAPAAEPGDNAPADTPQEQPAEEAGNGGTIALVVIAVLAAGGAGYYFKIVRPRQNADDDDYEEDEEEENNSGSFDDDTETNLDADGDDDEEDENE